MKRFSYVVVKNGAVQNTYDYGSTDRSRDLAIGWCTRYLSSREPGRPWSSNPHMRLAMDGGWERSPEKLRIERFESNDEGRFDYWGDRTIIFEAHEVIA